MTIVFVTAASVGFGATAGFITFVLCMIGMFLGAAGRAYKAAEKTDAEAPSAR
jgi:hypothetical protein